MLEDSPMHGDRSYPKSKRLLKKLDYKRTLETGSKVVCPELVVFAAPWQAGPRLGLIVSRKVQVCHTQQGQATFA